MAGGSLSQTRCATEPTRRMACHPSEARRTSPAARSSRGGGASKASTGDEVAATGTTAGRTSGAQNTVCSPKDPCGSCAKADAPFPPKLRRYFALGAVGDHRLVVPLVVDIATKTFPGDVRDVSILQAFVRLRRPPVECSHCFRPFAQLTKIAAQ